MNSAMHDDSRPVILIIDDDRTVVLTLHKVLSGMARTRFATDGAQAFAQIEACPPGLILLDYELPDMSGKEICTRLKQNPETRRIPVLFITSHTRSGIEQELLDVGAADYISKPLNPLMVAARAQVHLAYYCALQQLDAQVRTDSLTGLANRRCFDAHLNAEWKRACRHGRFLTLMRIEIDGFGKYSDHFGPQAGDECLKRVAQVLCGITRRSSDLAARVAGGAFAVILAETDPDEAAAIAGMLQKSVAQLQLEQAPEANYPQVTVSIGCTTTPPDLASRRDSLDEQGMVKAADRGLCASVHNGGNLFTYSLFDEPFTPDA